MWNRTRRGRSIIRQRRNDRNITKLKQKVNIFILLPFVIMVCLLVMLVVKTNRNVESLAYIDIKKTNNTTVKPYVEKAYKVAESSIKSTNIIPEEKVVTKTEVKKTKSLSTLTILGEIMMGGKVVKPQSGSYTSAFSTLGEYVENSDYVIANFTTNITDKDKIPNAKYKALVTEKILNAFNALNINAVNIANDHALDFGLDGIEKTKNILNEAEIDIIGLKNGIVYGNCGEIKVAVVAMCNQTISKQNLYEQAGLSMYNLNRIKKNIKTAKKNADIVVVMNHTGNELANKITNIMRWQYKKEIDYGADIVLGSHALGMYPVETYKGKPIIYSLGYLIHDTDIEIAKKSGIFNFNITKEGKLDSLEIIPTYIDNKERTINYYDVNNKDANTFLEYLGKNISEENKTIEKNQLIIKLNK